ncbi:small GTPase superfamily [Mycena rebaudengoi]|nr:small GTPase superfamily [Mycena rebaudengoi]
MSSVPSNNRIPICSGGGTGKTALTERFIHDTYHENTDPTIEEQYRRQILVDGEVSPLEVLDTAGQGFFKSLNDVYMKSANGFILVFSLTQEVSLKGVETLRDEIYQIKGQGSVPIVVAGLKSDLLYEREVDAATIESLSTQWNIPFYEVSAKRKWHADDVFEDLVRQLRQKYPPDPVRKPGKRQQGPCIIM